MQKPLVVVVDPGHGGKACGAVWPQYRNDKCLSGADLEKAVALHNEGCGVVEKDVNLSIALGLWQAVAEIGWPVALELTRHVDEDLTLGARGALSAKCHADLVVSIHCNSAADYGAKGMLGFTRPGDETAAFVASAILSAAPLQLKRRKDIAPEAIRTQETDWTSRAHAVLSQHSMAAVLIETGFLSNEHDRQFLTSAPGQAAVVASLLAGVAALWVVREAAAA